MYYEASPIRKPATPPSRSFPCWKKWHATNRTASIYPNGKQPETASSAILRRVFEAYLAAVDGRPNTRGGRHHINLLPTTVHVYFGSVTGATADGRGSGEVISERISPVQEAAQAEPEKHRDLIVRVAG